MANGRKTVEDIEKENDALRRQSELIQDRAKAARQEVEAIRAKVEAKKELVKIGIELKDAEIADGGSGAFYIYLKKKK